jgi:hypothetical protein
VNGNTVSGPNNSRLFFALLLESGSRRELKSNELTWIKKEKEETHFD